MPSDGAVDLIEAPRAERYSLSAEVFKETPTEIINYQQGDRINRANFIPYLISSFGFSLGVPQAQQEYLRWKEIHEGFDWSDSIKNFFEAGGIDITTDSERGMIINRFRQVERHEEDYADESDEVILNKFFNEIGYHLTDLHPRKLSDEEILNMTFQQLLARIKELKSEEN